jgi:hypothetical protein
VSSLNTRLGDPRNFFKGGAALFERDAQDAAAKVRGKTLGDGGGGDVVIAGDLDLIGGGALQVRRKEEEMSDLIAREQAERRS